ncbi:bifunctional diguanylate cyclase/phosphodiesterase [Xylophilus sp. Leaf220]|uniref:putative bifunctional diguanylate cyclase/phosphodiesterase n=1 Tax=Xylophilus sp. Leaf220 TaxID=1735686 RepID=UPI0006F453CE|nr:EAL domain-containing protein [Xylophilus sp. Leaf220]KQM79545.1 hypothetical protein ASE76_15935 [Xylophilus sp. Leaf220]
MVWWVDDRLQEEARLEALQSTGLLDTPASEGFDRITRLATDLFGVPIALVTLVDSERQWFKSRVGLAVQETTRGDSFCSVAMTRPGVMVVEDALLDPRFRDNALVVGEPGIRFYAGAPLVLPSGHALGSLCVIDRVPRSFSAAQCAQLQDLAALAMAQIDLARMAGRVDDTTHLPNRARFDDDLQDMCLATPGAERTLVMAEFVAYDALRDASRAVNNGPLEQRMRSAARMLRAEVAAHSPLYHVGMARFAFFLEGSDRAWQSAFVERLMAQAVMPVPGDVALLELQPRAGLVRFCLTPDEVQDVARKASSALHETQLQGRKLVFYEADVDERYRRSYGLLRDLQRAMGEGEFFLVYQPKLDTASLRYTGVEALIRWNHRSFGLVSPFEFIPMVEGTALIHLLTEWVLHTALAQLARWDAEGGPALGMAVNVSARNLEHPGFLRMLANACALHGIDPARLQIECTENAVLTGSATVQALKRARTLGVEVALDDFGVGYCNLACLHSMPAGLLKLDRSLIDPIAIDVRALAVLKAVIAIGQALGYRLLAEGVETAEVFDQLVAMGCDEMQGYYLCRPVAADAVLPFVQQWNASVALEA